LRTKLQLYFLHLSTVFQRGYGLINLGLRKRLPFPLRQKRQESLLVEIGPACDLHCDDNLALNTPMSRMPAHLYRTKLIFRSRMVADSPHPFGAACTEPDAGPPADARGILDLLDGNSCSRFASGITENDEYVNGQRNKRDSGSAALRNCIQRAVQLRQLKSALARTYLDVEGNHTLQMAAALSYYFVMALFPALIFLSAVVAFLPISGLFDQALNLMGRFVPPDGMVIVRKVLSDVVTPNRGTFLSLGLLGTLWTASGGFAAAIEALNIAYDAKETRPFWKTRPLAMVLTLVIGLLLLVALAVMIVGPHFGQWLANHIHLSQVWLWAWPYIHWMISVGFTVLAVEALYFLAPNVKQRFLATLPGAILSVMSWIGLSYLLGIYFRTFANFNKTYGTLGAGIALMVWLYWTGFAMLAGAELNAELAKRTKEGAVEQKNGDSARPVKLIA
jgi:membrane protein